VAAPDPPRRAPLGQLTSAASALGLLFCMFALKWFGTVGRPDGARTSGHESASGPWSELTVLSILLVVTAVVALGAVALHISQRGGSRTDAAPLVAALGAVSAVLLSYRLLIEPPSPDSVVDVKVGAMLALLATLGIATGGLESIQARRSRSRPSARRPSPHPDVAIEGQSD
jgi:membrane associated rhomboid family serine protease